MKTLDPLHSKQNSNKSGNNSLNKGIPHSENIIMFTHSTSKNSKEIQAEHALKKQYILEIQTDIDLLEVQFTLLDVNDHSFEVDLRMLLDSITSLKGEIKDQVELHLLKTDYAIDFISSLNRLEEKTSELKPDQIDLMSTIIETQDIDFEQQVNILEVDEEDEIISEHIELDAVNELALELAEKVNDFIAHFPDDHYIVSLTQTRFLNELNQIEHQFSELQQPSDDDTASINTYQSLSDQLIDLQDDIELLNDPEYAKSLAEITRSIQAQQTATNRQSQSENELFIDAEPSKASPPKTLPIQDLLNSHLTALESTIEAVFSSTDPISARSLVTQGYQELKSINDIIHNLPTESLPLEKIKTLEHSLKLLSDLVPKQSESMPPSSSPSPDGSQMTFQVTQDEPKRPQVPLIKSNGIKASLALGDITSWDIQYQIAVSSSDPEESLRALSNSIIDTLGQIYYVNQHATFLDKTLTYLLNGAEKLENILFKIEERFPVTM